MECFLTTSEEEIYKSLANVLSTDVDTLEWYIGKIKSIGSINDVDLSALKIKTGCSMSKTIDYISINHISPRININNIYCEPILTLKNILLSKNDLTDFLSQYGITFCLEQNDMLSIKLNDRLYDFKETTNNRLKTRLGRIAGCNDYCVNGFLFSDVCNEPFFNHYLGSPEILKDISIELKDNSIADKFADKANNYIISFMAPFKKVTISTSHKLISDIDKTKLIIKYCIMYLVVSKLKPVKPYLNFDNPVLYMPDNYDVPSEDIIQIHKLIYNNNIWNTALIEK